MSNAVVSFAPDAMIGRYKIVRRIGAGGMGEVYEAVHTDLGRRVAIKTLLPSMALRPEIRARFVREGQVAARINHPNAVAITDVFVHGETACLVMEFLEGEDLAEHLRREGRLAPEAIARVMLPVLAAIDAAQREEIVHRDLKPANIFLHRTRDGVVQSKVLDFGISKMLDGIGPALTGSAALLGTPQYMSPEQIQSTKRVGPRSDQYALGVILYECATGQNPFAADSLAMLVLAISEGRFSPPRDVCLEVPPVLESIICRAMARDPAARFASVRHLAAELLAFADPLARMTWEPVFGAPSLAPPPPAPTPMLRPSAPSAAPDVVTPAPSQAPSTLDAVPRDTTADERPKPRAWLLPAALAAVVGVGLSSLGAFAAWHRHSTDTVTSVAPPALPVTRVNVPQPAAPQPAAPSSPIAVPPGPAAPSAPAAPLPQPASSVVVPASAVAAPPPVAAPPTAAPPTAASDPAAAQGRRGRRHRRLGLLPSELTPTLETSGTNAMPVVQ